MYNLSIKSFALRGALCLCLWGACLPNNVSAIFNGAQAPIDMFPEMVQLSHKTYRSFVCSGFLVTDRHVVTAAHCVLGYADGNDLKVIAKSTYTIEGGIERDIEAFYLPLDYNADINDWNVAVIKLKEPFPLGPGIQVGSMSDKPWVGEEIIRIAGWGVTEDGGYLASQLMTSALSTISDSACETNIYTSKNEDGEYKHEFLFTDTMSCALDVKDYANTCVGDYGGPVYIGRKIYGIVSWSLGCRYGQGLSIYTSVAKVRKFIDVALCHEASAVDVENMQSFIPELLCDGESDVSFYDVKTETITYVKSDSIYY